MGSPPDEVARSSDEQSATGQYTVQISQDFYMGVYEVTAAQYAAVLDESPCFFQGQRGGGPDYPVENVSWHDAVRFCNRLSDRTAERRAGRSYRLPTEAEWEYACRAGSTTAFSFGNTLGSRQANFDGLFPLPHGARGPFRARTAPFGSYPANAWGLHDMHGNVAEWVQDWYHAAYPAGPARDPRGPSSGLAPVVRGGHWLGTARFCRSAYRVDYDANDRCSYIGFRVVMQVAGADRNHATP
jgi:formylglycine-generating enzyme required for sulfatase activity